MFTVRWLDRLFGKRRFSNIHTCFVMISCSLLLLVYINFDFNSSALWGEEFYYCFLASYTGVISQESNVKQFGSSYLFTHSFIVGERKATNCVFCNTRVPDVCMWSLYSLLWTAVRRKLFWQIACIFIWLYEKFQLFFWNILTWFVKIKKNSALLWGGEYLTYKISVRYLLHCCRRYDGSVIRINNSICLHFLIFLIWIINSFASRGDYLDYTGCENSLYPKDY